MTTINTLMGVLVAFLVLTALIIAILFGSAVLTGLWLRIVLDVAGLA